MLDKRILVTTIFMCLSFGLLLMTGMAIPLLLSSFALIAQLFKEINKKPTTGENENVKNKIF